MPEWLDAAAEMFAPKHQCMTPEEVAAFVDQRLDDHLKEVADATLYADSPREGATRSGSGLQVAAKQAEYVSSTMREVLDDITGASRRAALPRWRRWLLRLLAR